MTRCLRAGKLWVLGLVVAAVLAFGLSSTALAGVIYPGSGDVNGDGQLTITDGLLIAQHVVGLTTVDEATADVNGDGNVTITDALLVAQEVVGLI